jgi:hypothetical protein
MAATPWDRRRGLAPRLAVGLAVAAAAAVLAAAGPASADNDDGWKSGTRGGDMQDFATWRATSLGVAVGWAPWDTWSNMTGWFAGTNPKALRARNPNVSIALGLFPTGGSLSACAAGRYDANFATIAGRLVAAGVGDAELRLGWEPGSTDRPWHAVGRPADQWKACFVSAAKALLAAGPDLRIAWHMNKKGSKGPGVTNLWDSDVAAVVTNIGVSNYDDEYARFGTELSKGHPWGLRAWLAFAHAPVAVARDRLDHALLEASDGQLGLGLDEAFEGRNAGGHRLGQQLADGADLVMDEPRDVVVAGHEPPQPPADDQRHHQGGGNAHVLEVLDVDRRHAAEEAQGHVEVPAGDRRDARPQRDGGVPDIRQHPDAVALVQPARDLGDVRGGVAVAEVGLELGLPLLGQDLAVPLVVEAVDHDPVVAGEIPEDPRRLVAERAQGRGREDCLESPLGMPGEVDRRASALQLDDESAAVLQPMEQAIEVGGWPTHAAPDRDRDGVQRLAEVGTDAVP